MVAMLIGTFTTFTYVIPIPMWVNFAAIGIVLLAVLATIVWTRFRRHR